MLCSAGISRSTTVVCACIMAVHDLSFWEAIGHVHRCRDTVCPNPGFLTELQAFERSPLLQQLRGRLSSPVYAADDLEFMLHMMHEASLGFEQFKSARFVFAADGSAVPPELEAGVCDRGDGNGLCTEDAECRRKKVLRNSCMQEGDPALKV